MLPFLKWWETLLSMNLSISDSIGPLVNCRVWLSWFHTSHSMSQNLLIRTDIHRSPVVLAQRYWRRRFCISDQLDDVSPMRAWSHPILCWISDDLDTGRGRERGSVDNWPFYHVEIPWIIAAISWGDSLLRLHHFWRNFWSRFHLLLGGSLRLDTYPNPAKYIKKNPWCPFCFFVVL